MNSLDQYPDVLNVDDIQEILGIGRRQAYELVSSGQFHTVRVGKRIKILKAVFVRWLDGEEETDNIHEKISNLD
ncbi:helix-turn-helix domain-containing protein [Metabacillus iocasae]|uniref:DNA-binding transcriptional regulator AlpA n=1 Tax=Priestia iocasae TaxID=2291674 RepID=A0ABS2QTR0_9BACI|nr:helix-turn-helix domain-containing protein [Metabacillus iocasae]MBM7702851.1 putative DNA-binding transcriptional regulator AlpA [Metabacillus iocasae]